MLNTLRIISAYLESMLPRLSGWSAIAIALLAALALTHPAQLGVVLYKSSLVVLASVLGYWIDRSLFPYARPHTQLKTEPSTLAALLMLRRSVIVLACILGLTLGL